MRVTIRKDKESNSILQYKHNEMWSQIDILLRKRHYTYGCMSYKNVDFILSHSTKTLIVVQILGIVKSILINIREILVVSMIVTASKYERSSTF